MKIDYQNLSIHKAISWYKNHVPLTVSMVDGDRFLDQVAEVVKSENAFENHLVVLIMDCLSRDLRYACYDFTIKGSGVDVKLLDAMELIGITENGVMFEPFKKYCGMMRNALTNTITTNNQYYAVRLRDMYLCAGDENVYFAHSKQPSLFRKEKAEKWAAKYPGSVIEKFETSE